MELYRRTGDKKYLDTADHILRHFGYCKNILSRPESLKGHSGGWTLFGLSLLEVYRATGAEDLKGALTRMHELMVRDHLQPHGSPSGEFEQLAGTGPYVDTELCDPFWWIWWWTEMTALTGESRYADFAEKAIFNALPGHRSKDGKVMSYFMAPNQLIATKTAGTGQGCHYPSRLYIECCQSNGPRVLPIVVERMVQATRDGGLAVLYYGASETLRRARRRRHGDFAANDGLSLRGDHPHRVVRRAAAGGVSAAAAGARLVQDAEDRRQRPGRRRGTPRRHVRTPEPRVEDGRHGRTQPADVDSCRVLAGNGGIRRAGAAVVCVAGKGRAEAAGQVGRVRGICRTRRGVELRAALGRQRPRRLLAIQASWRPPGKHVWEQSPVALEVKAFRLPAWQFQPAEKVRGHGGAVVAALGSRLPSGCRRKKPPETVQLVPFGFTLLRMTYLPWRQVSKREEERQ